MKHVDIQAAQLIPEELLGEVERVARSC